MMDIPIYIVNLKRRDDRQIKLTKELAEHNIDNYQFTEAVDGKDLNLPEMAEKNLISFERTNLKSGEVGCYLSHYNILKSILNSSNELNLILEDDVWFVPNFRNRLNRALRLAKNAEWDMFFIGIHYHDGDFPRGNFIGHKGDGIFYPDNLIYGTHAYLIKKSSVQKIIDLMFPVKYPVDAFYSFANVKKLALANVIVKTVDNSDSDTVIERQQV